MKRIICVIITYLIFLLVLVVVAQAQTTINVDINRASLAWDWAQGSGGVPDNFTVKCGQSAGNYTKITQVTFPTQTIPVSQAIAGQGNWFCVVTAINQFGESGATNELPFAAGAVPLAPSNARIISK